MSFPPQGLDKSDVLANQSTLLTRLSAARAGYLDNINQAGLLDLTSGRVLSIDDIDDALKHKTYIFPGDTSLTCTLTAGQALDTWSTWAEFIDSAANNFSSLLAVADGHITVIQQEEVSDENTLYQLEVSYGEDKTHITSQRFAGSGKFQNPDNHARVFSGEIPAGESVYYRLKSNTAVADTVLVHIRYHTH